MGFAFATAEQPSGPPLTHGEIATLPDETPVVVIWSGGNGPHRYVARWLGACLLAWSEWELQHHRLPPADRDLLSFSGQQSYHTRVWRAAEKPE